MKKRFKAGLLAFLMMLMLVIGITPASAAATGYSDVSSAYTALNDFRTTRGVWYWNSNNVSRTVFNTNSGNKLGKLKRSTKLEKVAKTRAKEISVRFSHTRPNGQSCFTAYPNMNAKGENIANGQNSVSEVMKNWKEEDKKYDGQGHRRNMLSKKFNAVGIACYKASNGRKYWVQCFGKL